MTISPALAREIANLLGSGPDSEADARRRFELAVWLSVKANDEIAEMTAAQR